MTIPEYPSVKSRAIQISILLMGVLILSQAAIIIRLCDTHPISITFYRLFLALLLLLPFTYKQILNNINKITWSSFGTLLLMAICFVSHFYTWIWSLQLTKVANSATCFALNPIFISFGAYLFFKERPNKGTSISICFGILGVTIIGYNDFGFSSSDLWGDLLAILSSILFSLYFLFGRSLRKHFPNLFIMCFVYFIGALISIVIIVSFKLPLWNFTGQTKIALMALAFFPTILGHASIIYSSKHFKSSTISGLTLTEPLFAGIVAYLIFMETVSYTTFVGYLFISFGILVLLQSRLSTTFKVKENLK